MNSYTIRTEPTGHDSDVYYILEQDSEEIFKHKGSSLIDTYTLFGHNMELLKIVMHHGKDNSKEATDYFVEETYMSLNKFNLLKPRLMKEKKSIEQLVGLILLKNK